MATQLAPITYRRISVRRASPLIGAWVEGVRLGPSLGVEVLAEIKQAFEDHLVLFFEKQDISPDEHRSFGRLFGNLLVHEFLPPLDGYSEIVVLENDKDRPPQVNFWHADVTFLEQPPLGSILLARHIPGCGGDTIWSSMYAAYDALSEGMRRLLDGFSAVHVGQVDQYEAAYGRKSEPRAPPQAKHPVVRTHPSSGRKALFVNPASTTRIIGLPKMESDALLRMLFEHIQTPEFQVRLSWREGTVAFWDNRCTQHYAVADYWPDRRLMHRVTIEGDRPQ